MADLRENPDFESLSQDEKVLEKTREILEGGDYLKLGGVGEEGALTTARGIPGGLLRRTTTDRKRPGTTGGKRRRNNPWMDGEVLPLTFIWRGRMGRLPDDLNERQSVGLPFKILDFFRYLVYLTCVLIALYESGPV